MFNTGVSEGIDRITVNPISGIGRHARIYRAETNHMQCTPRMPSEGDWIIDFEEFCVTKDRAMGWFNTHDNLSISDLHGDSLDQAIQLCKSIGTSFQVEVPREKKLELKSYAHNFLWRGEPEVDSEDLED